MVQTHNKPQQQVKYALMMIVKIISHKAQRNLKSKKVRLSKMTMRLSKMVLNLLALTGRMLLLKKKKKIK
jgi:hypothetical protein